MKKLWKRATRKRDVQTPTDAPAPPHITATSLSLSTNAIPILAILKDGGEMLKDVPYLQAIAGILNTLFKIWEEIKSVDSLTEELLESVQRRSEKLVQTLQKLVKQGSWRLLEIERDVKEYKDLLESIANDLQAMQASGSVSRWLQRTESREKIHRHMRQLTEFGETFTISRLTTLVMQADTIVQWTSKHDAAVLQDELPMFKDGQPSSPRLFLGRDTELEIMRDILLKNPSPRLAILGPGGMGKTTVAQQLMNDEEVSTTFPIPLFACCENATSPTAVLNAVADVLHIPADQRGRTLQTSVLKQLRSQTGCLLCLDNFEDAWDPPDTRGDIEELLGTFGGVRSIGVVITMRGTEKPRGLNWTRPYPPPLEPLGIEPARALFSAVSNSDEDAYRLLMAVDNVPLAIVLLGRLVEEEGLDYVLFQWKTEGLKVVDRGDTSDKRTTSVTASINLSLKSPRIASIPFICDVVGILAILPDGLSGSMIDALQANLPPGVNLRRVLQALVRVALCFMDAHRRYRLLAPIRQHVQHALPTHPSFLDGVRRTFLEHVIEADTPDYDAVVPEMSNIRAFVASEATTWSQTRIRACLSYIWWENLILGVRDVALALKALTHTNDPILQVRCQLRISELLKSSSQYEQARDHLCSALSINTGDPCWEGQVQLQMGDMELLLHRFEHAETFLQKAVQIFKKADMPTREGVALEKLGTLFRFWGRTSEAEQALVRSLELAKEAGEVVGEGNALHGLSEVFQLTGRMSEAEDALRQVIDCYQRSHSVRVEAIAFQSLGEVQYYRGDFEESERSLLTSRDLSARIHDLDGNADALRWLGLVYSQMDGRHGLAVTHIKDALVIFEQISSMDNQAYTHEDLGNLYFQQGHSSKATTHWVISITFHLRRLHKSQWKRVTPICAQIQVATGDGMDSTV